MLTGLGYIWKYNIFNPFSTAFVHQPSNYMSRDTKCLPWWSSKHVHLSNRHWNSLLPLFCLVWLFLFGLVVFMFGFLLFGWEFVCLSGFACMVSFSCNSWASLLLLANPKKFVLAPTVWLHCLSFLVVLSACIYKFGLVWSLAHLCPI